jgi:thioredoxin-dependent peroxiredoxin
LLKPGDTAPDFTLPDEVGRPVSLGVLLGVGPVALVFYPRDFTPVCTREVCMVRDAHSELAAAGISVLGISADSVESHERFRAQHGLTFPLRADVDKTVCRAYGALGLFGFGTRRITYLIGRDFKIVDAVNAALRVGAHEALLQRALSAATR